MSFLQPQHYYNPEIFVEEKEKIFSNQWLFAGLTDDVAEPKDYFVVELLGKSVIIYNSRDGLKAFQNVCPHRFNLIFTEEKGNSPLLCKYHSWGFDQDGKLIGKDKKNITPSPINLDICLKRYELAVVGKFIFINFARAPLPIEEQLGEMKQELEIISEAIGEKVHERRIPHRANWKFMIENVVDFQHCRSVHEETFGKLGGCIMPPDEQRRIKHNSLFVFPPPDTKLAADRVKFMEKHFPRKILNGDYKHMLVFPNMTIACGEGFTFTIGQFLPVDADNTIYNLRWYFAKLIDPKPNAPHLVNQMFGQFAPFVDQIFAEDIIYLENLQRGVKEIEHSGFVYNTEQRIGWFLDSYERLMTEKAVGTIG